MKKFKIFLVVLALVVGTGGAFAVEKPELLLGKTFGCSNAYCQGFVQYVDGGSGQLVLAPQGGEGITWICKYKPWVICTYAYMYCPQYGTWGFVPCRTGEFCFFNPDYTCNPTPPWLSGKDSVITLTEAQKKQIEAAKAEFLDQ